MVDKGMVGVDGESQFPIQAGQSAPCAKSEGAQISNQSTIELFPERNFTSPHFLWNKSAVLRLGRTGPQRSPEF